MWNVQVPHNAWTPALFGSLGLKRSDPSFRCHSKGLAEKFDECARLPIADLGSNRLHSTSLNQQLYSFHQTHLSSPKLDRKSTRLNSSHGYISYAVFCLKKKKYPFFTTVRHSPPRLRPHTHPR